MVTSRSRFRFLAVWAFAVWMLGSSLAQAAGRSGLVIADDRAYPPFIYLDAQGQARGITVDIWRLWSRRTGVPIRFELMAWDQALAALRGGRVDAIGGMFHTRARERDFAFTRPLQSITTSIFFDRRLVGVKDVSDLAGFRVGVVRGDSAEELLASACPAATTVPFDDARSLVDAALAGTIRVIVADAPVVHYYLAQHPDRERLSECGAPLAVNRLCAAVRRGDQETQRLVETGFAQISDADIQAVMANWSGTIPERPVPWHDIALGVSAVLLLLGGTLLWNVALHRRVTEATAVLHERNAELEQSRDALLASEADLRDSEARYRAVVESIEDVYYRTDQTGTLRMLSPSGARLLGYDSPEQMVGRPNYSFWAEPERRAAMLQRLRAEGAVYDYEVDLRHSDGSVVHVSTTTKLLLDDDGQLRGIEGIFRDIGARKAAETALRESEARFRAVFENAPYAITITRAADGSYLDVNEAFARSIGLSREEACRLERAPVKLTFAPDQGQAVERVGSSEPVVNVRASVTMPDGDQRHILLSTAPVSLAGEDCIIAMVVDVTAEERAVAERERLREELAQAQKLESIGRLAGGVAHDFNNMLGVIIGHADFALQRMGSQDALQRDLSEIRAAAERSADLTRQLLTFARRQTVEPRLLDVNDTVSGMLRMLRRLIGENVELTWHPGTDLGLVRIDPSQLDQVLANLCVNARDAIADTGRVTIGTSRTTLSPADCAGRFGLEPGDYVCLSVTDTGSGMSAETLAHLFEPFYTTKADGQGTGLGLATVHGIVHQNGGFIDVRSALGEGTSFDLYLPRVDAEPPPEVVRAEAETLCGGSETVLLVEDDSSVLAMASMMLERLGYQVLAANGPEEALSIAATYTEPVHLLLTDVVMPVMNGRDLAETLLARRDDLRVLFMSGYTAGIIAQHGVLEDDVPFIEKPFGMGALSAKVRAVLDGPQ